MSEFKTPFKCYWKHQTGTIYTITDSTDDKFWCTWFDDVLDREDCTTYCKSSLLNQIEEGRVIVVQTAQDLLVTILQSEYDNLVEEVNMLQELIAELSAPQDTAQEQQAETYRALQMLLVSHPSFQDGAGENTTHLEELVNTVMELHAAWDRLASTPKKDVTDTTGFKPISKYTLADWEQAKFEGGVFEQNSGSLVKIGKTNYEESYPIELLSVDDLEDHKGIVMLNGCYWEDKPEDKDSIKRRVK